MKSIVYGSCTTAVTDKNYTQIDKGLAVVYGEKRFHQILYGHHFTIVTNHKLLLRLFGETKSIPPLASGCIQRWVFTLSAYEYTVWYRKGCDMSNANAVSRIPLKVSSTPIPIPEKIICLVNLLDVDEKILKVGLNGTQ